jgi:hypothetical protein
MSSTYESHQQELRWYTNASFLHGANYILGYMCTRATYPRQKDLPLEISINLETYTHFQASGFL